MTRQTNEPIDHISLNPSFMTVSELVKWIDRSEITLTPPYQRGQVWTEDQRVALIQTWLRGLPAGVVILSDRCAPAWAAANPDHDPNTHMDEPQWACVDGKQRLTTALMWFHGEFAVPASWFPDDHVANSEDTQDGLYVRYSGLTLKGQRFMDRYAALLVARPRAAPPSPMKPPSTSWSTAAARRRATPTWPTPPASPGIKELP